MKGNFLPPSGPVPTTNWTAVGFGLALASLAAYQMFKLPPALPVMLEAYGYDRVLAGAFMSIFAIAGIALSLRVGNGLKRHGPWPYLIAAAGLFLSGEAIALMVPENGAAMLVGRGLEGVGYTICAIAGPLIANLNASPRQLPLVIGLTATWVPVGQLMASLISLPVVALDQWRPLWWVGVGLTLALAVWGLRIRRDTTMNMTMGNMTMGRAGKPPAGVADRPGDDRPGDDLPGRGPSPAIERRALIAAAAVFGVWSGQYIGYMTWLPAFLVETHDFAPEIAVFAYMTPTALVLIFCLITGALLRAGAPLIPLMIGSMAVQAALWLATPITGSGWLGVAALIAYGVSSGITPVCLFSLPSAIMGGDRVDGRAFGIVMTGRNMGILVGPVLLAQAVALSADWSLVWPLYGGATIIAAAGTVYLGGLLKRLRVGGTQA